MDKESLRFIDQLEAVIAQRKSDTQASTSYTRSLFQAGVKKIAQKVGEEAVELGLEAVDSENESEFLGEAADLFYHYLVLLRAREYTLDDVIQILKDRHRG